jgi:hypothetical protein
MSRIAPLLASWKRRYPNAGPAKTRGTGEVPVGPLMVEILIDGQWANITPYVYARDKITIRRGQSSEGGSVEPGSCRFTLNNRDGRFSPRNPNGIYYGKIGRNTQVRVSVPDGFSKNYRFWGEISSWPAQWDTTGKDVWVPIEASGILRRLTQGATALNSALYRAITNITGLYTPIVYWPCEDGTDSTHIASAIQGGTPMTITGTPTLASVSSFQASQSLPDMNAGSFRGVVPTYTDTGEIQVRFLLSVPAAGTTDGQSICHLAGTGTVKQWSLLYETGSGGALRLRGYDSSGTIILDTGEVTTFAVDGKLLRVSIELLQDGPDVDWAIETLQIGVTTLTGVSWSGVLSGNTMGRIDAITMARSQALTGTAIGHITMQNRLTTLADLYDEGNAYVGETATDRMSRLCDEEDVSISLYSTSDTTMGAQRANATFLELIDECVEADQGVLVERDTAFGLAYRSRSGLHNLTATLALSYTDNQLSDIPGPVEDDQNLHNDVTCTRPLGSSARVTKDEGPLSTLPPPSGVGKYDQQTSVNVELDTHLQDQAAWRVHLGTVDEPRYPQLSINLAHPQFTTVNPTLRTSALSMLPSLRLTVSSLPDWLPPGDISQICLGIQETLDRFEHRITFNGQPESPYRVAVADSDTFGKADTDGSELALSISTTETSLSVSVTDGPLWTTDAGEFPFDILIGGETMTVSGISGASSPQAFTISARSVNGVIKAHANGAELRLARPAVAAL